MTRFEKYKRVLEAAKNEYEQPGFNDGIGMALALFTSIMEAPVSEEEIEDGARIIHKAAFGKDGGAINNSDRKYAKAALNSFLGIGDISNSPSEKTGIRRYDFTAKEIEENTVDGIFTLDTNTKGNK